MQNRVSRQSAAINRNLPLIEYGEAWYKRYINRHTSFILSQTNVRHIFVFLINAAAFFFFIKKYKELENSSPFYVEPQGSSDVCERACNNCLHRRMSNLHLNHSPVAHPLPSSDEAFYNGTHQLN